MMKRLSFWWHFFIHMEFFIYWHKESVMSGFCALCTKEKFHITFKPGVGPLNKKNEMFNNCRHKRRVLLCQKSDQDLDQGWILPTIIVFYLCWPHLQSSLWWLHTLRSYLWFVYESLSKIKLLLVWLNISIETTQ